MVVKAEKKDNPGSERQELFYVMGEVCSKVFRHCAESSSRRLGRE